MARIDLASLGVHFNFDRCRYNSKMSHSLGNEKSVLIHLGCTIQKGHAYPTKNQNARDRQPERHLL